MEGGGTLVDLCLEAASRSADSVRSWRRQRRTLEILPAHLAESLLHQLLVKNLFSPPLLELFQLSVEELDLNGELSVDAEWMAYIGGFRHLRVLKVESCKALNNSAIWHLSGMESIEELRVDRCSKITNQGLEHILTLGKLKHLGLSETGIGEQGIGKLAVLRNLSHLDLGGLPVTDSHVSSLLVLQLLIDLQLWGSSITNEGANMLRGFPRLEILNLAWTKVSVVPSMPRVSQLNLSHCVVLSVSEEGSALDQLRLSGATIQDPLRVLHSHSLPELSVLELSATNLAALTFLGSLKRVVKLDLSSMPSVSSDTMNLLAKCARNLKHLDLSDTRVGSEGVAVLTGHVPALEHLSLRGTSITDSVFGYLGLMPLLIDIDLSNTSLTGAPVDSSFWSVLHLQQLHNLRRLDLRRTRFSDKSCKRLACLVRLTHLLLCAEFLTDASLHELSALPNLRSLAFQGTVLTDAGLRSLKPPPPLEELDLTDCWLLTEGCLLQFCDYYRSVTVKHDRIAGNLNSQRSSVRRMRVKNPHVPVKTQSKIGRDERIRYTFSELHELRALTSEVAALEMSTLPRELSRTLQDEDHIEPSSS
ncbi:uncharacterized protein LOC9661924 [Selaginella moellendorffii]|uniref:uncharacterized protein LOC9661924 n=1 Tax=Selaginella moellendorffii TaxID=88036 RepID=UPI000D1CB07D|nr:uncharacterized protein LOC9661924 [Selaginella moellendorffii]|eukprot:XP_024543662.1 uncharacterized protein LOC9661924 [Selaginella moellendorffii]